MEQAEPDTIPDNDEAPAETPPPQLPTIPWEQRKQIGSFRAYWRTAKMVMTSPSQLEQFLDAPVCEKHAKKFRRATFQLTFTITLGVMATLLTKTFMIAYTPGCSMREVESAMLMIFLRLGLAVLSLIGLFLATRSLEWFSSPKDFEPVRQDRAIALSCYACGPLLVGTVIGAMISLAVILTRPVQDMGMTLGVINLAWWAVFLAWWPAAVRAIHFTTGRSIQRTTITAILLPLIWTGQQLLVGIIPISIIQWILISTSLS